MEEIIMASLPNKELNAFSSVSLTAQMNSFFDENPNIKIEAVEYKVNQRVVDYVPLKDRECLLIYREGDE